MFKSRCARAIAAASLVFSVVSGAHASSDPLRVDAGASPLSVAGRVSFNGSVWGGAAPYRYQWSVPGAEMVNATNPVSGLLVDDWTPGHYEASLTVTDAAGASATDTVKFVVDGAPLLAVPQALAGGTYEFESGASQILRGRVDGGEAPYEMGWDLDLDGAIDAKGAEVETDFPRGHHLVRFLVRDASGLESQQMTSVYVGSREEIAEDAIPLTIIGISDSGVNPYHSEFSAATYPDPRVLELTQNFTRHPCEYLSNYPCRSIAIPITLGEGYYPEQDQALWHFDAGVEPFMFTNLLYWIPGTKIIGAYSNGGYDAAPADLIVDNNGHGTGSASVALGNRYGYCPTCLFFIVDSLDDDVVYGFEWAEITSHSHGYTANLPLGATALNDPLDLLIDPSSKDAVERGVSVIFSAGNGVGNAFTVTNETYGSDMNGPAWTVIVGALRRDTSGAIVGEGTPAHVSSWGDGFLPSACRTGVDATCAHSGTSAAAPYTAGVFGQVLRGVREALGDYRTGVREGQVIAEGLPIAASPFLADGQLTRRELRAAVIKSASALNADSSLFPYPVNTNAETRFVFEGYGAATPNAAARALAVLLGEAEMPQRSDEDAFFALDCEIRDALYGGYDRDGDGNADSCAKDIAGDPLFAGNAAVSNEAPFTPFARTDADLPVATVLDRTLSYRLHRTLAHEPYRTAADCGLPQTANEEDHQQFMSQREDIAGDLEPCFDSRITGTVGGFRPKGIFAADDVLDGLLHAGSTINVTLYLQSLTGGPVVMEAFATADDREIGRSGDVTNITVAQSYTQYDFTISTDRVAVPGERLGVHFTLTGTTEWAYGFTGDHASVVTVTPASGALIPMGAMIDTLVAEGADTLVSGRVGMPDQGTDVVLGNAGFAPVTVAVQVATQADFADAVWATLDPQAGTFMARLKDINAATIYARAFRNNLATPTVSASAGRSVETDARAGLTTRGGALGGSLLLTLVLLAIRRRAQAARV